MMWPACLPSARDAAAGRKLRCLATYGVGFGNLGGDFLLVVSAPSSLRPERKILVPLKDDIYLSIGQSRQHLVWFRLLDRASGRDIQVGRTRLEFLKGKSATPKCSQSQGGRE
eukprot:1355775-Amorphochlora_amoeboformis.AAC.1